MAIFLKDFKEVQDFHKVVKECDSDVYLIKNDGSEEFNLKSALSEFIALGRLAEKYGDQYEIFCQNSTDEAKIMKYLYQHNK